MAASSCSTRSSDRARCAATQFSTTFRTSPCPTHGDSVTEFPPNTFGNIAPINTLDFGSSSFSGGFVPLGLTFDSVGNLFVIAGRAIFEFPAGWTSGTSPISSISGSATQLNGAEAMDLDVNGNIYVANSSSNAVTIYPAGSNGNVPPTVTISGQNTGLNLPLGIAVVK